MNLASVLALSAVADTAFGFVAIAALKRHRITVRLATPYSIAALSLCAFAQVGFAMRIDELGEVIVFILLTGCVGVSVVTDVAAGYVLDAVTVPSLAAALLTAAIDGHAAQVFWGALCVSGAIVLLYGMSRGRGIGLGDAKLAACVGALLGARDGLVSLGFAFVLGGAYAAVLLLSRRGGRKQSVAFAPYMAAGVFAVLSLRAA